MLIEEKNSLRKRLKAQGRDFPTGWYENCSHQLVCAVKQHPRFQSARVVMLFHPLPDEPDIRPLMNDFYMSKKVLLPVVENSEMLLKCYKGAGTLRSGTYGIQEPVGEEFTDYAAIDFILVPGLAFTPQGCRLGRGGGFYDRFLSRPEVCAYRLGICYPFRILDSIPHDTHDVCVDEVVHIHNL